MPFREFLNPNNINIDKTARSKTAVLLKLCQLFNKAYPQLDVETLFDAYWKRETMGSTTIGHGIMIPHIRCESIDTLSSCVLKLQNPIDFGADDKQPIHLVLGLLVPSAHINEHLQTLSKITQQFSQPEFRRACREATDVASLNALLTQNSLNEITDCAVY